MTLRPVTASPIDWSRVPEDRVHLSLAITLTTIALLAVLAAIALFRHWRRPRS